MLQVKDEQMWAESEQSIQNAEKFVSILHREEDENYERGYP